ncbi:MAG: T9SS type A sorting domain-containing protein [Melioribacteraceae bacterium]|nr:T9SS type A sorting domain-containing protein [Melioribacteraceae bacterium]
MKLLKKSILILFILHNLLFAYLSSGGVGQPEFYIKIADTDGWYYRIKAEKLENEPIYDENFNYTTNFNSVWNEVNSTGSPVSFQATYLYKQAKGFDWLQDNQDGLGTLGYGVYKITIQTSVDHESYTNALSFYLNVRSINNVPGGTGSPDLQFYLTFSAGSYQSGFVFGYYPPGGSPQNYTVTSGATFKIWELNQGWTLDESNFIENITLKNDFSGSQNSDVKIVLKEKNEGFPTSGIDYVIDHQFNTGTQVKFWKGAKYKFSVSQEVKNNHKIHFWNDTEDNRYGNTAELEIENNQQEIKANFTNAYSQKNVNNLEGMATGGTYDLSWIFPVTEDKDYIVNSSQAFYVYDFTKRSDLYNITVSSQLNNLLGTNWKFLNWNDGTTGLSKTNVQFASNNQHTALFKGTHFTNSSSTFAKAGQRKLYWVYPNGDLIMVYESMNKIWLEKSTNGGSTWTLCNNDQSLNNSGTASEPSIALYDEAYPSHCIAYKEVDNGVQFIKLIVINNQYNIIGRHTVASTSGTCSNPTIAISGSSQKKVIITWKESSGLKYRTANITSAGSLNWINANPMVVSYTNSSSVNPTVECGDTEAHIAWQQSNTIKYIKYNFGSSSFSGYTTVSDYNSTLNNHNTPSITVVSNKPKVSWLASHYITLMQGVAVREYNSGWGAVSSYWGNGGSEITNSQITRTRDGYYLLGWSLENGEENKYIKSSALSSIKTTSQEGKYVQIASEAPNFGSAKILAQKVNTTPFTFATSSVTSGLAKGTEKTIAGKIGTIKIGNEEYCFDIGDVTLEKENLFFSENVKEKSANELFRTETFVLDENSDLEFSLVSKEITENIKTELKEDEKIEFVLQIVESKSNEVIGDILNKNFDKNNKAEEKGNYRINVKNVGSKEVYLRLSLLSNVKGEVTLSNYYIDGEGNFKKEDVEEIILDNSLAINNYQLFANYPNPFNPSTKIDYQLPKAGHVTLKIFNMLGQEVATLVDGVKEKGRYSVNFNAKHLASGTYIYTLQAGDYKVSKKMILLK